MSGQGGNNEFVLIEHSECIRRISDELGEELKQLTARVERLEKRIINEHIFLAFQEKIWDVLKSFIILVFPMALVFLIDHVFDNIDPYPAQESAQLFRELLVVMFMGFGIGYGVPAFVVSLIDLNYYLNGCTEQVKARQDLKDLMHDLKKTCGNVAGQEDAENRDPECEKEEEEGLASGDVEEDEEEVDGQSDTEDPKDK
ncbi:uncharacterized protein LOC106169617 [Lingula anatina]|uniref:Uncharacterized protein LOC106169617 n=1 Tax=Lingula anatina TaxID=7574 RepID=A0A1S3J3Z8_LINAN|nr:uncharacterized protein LOC106169617 [Lingula anatina]|eukprot:XP_013404584.1 uncharacterized protein LOC106169617 [Lingula anatina]